MRHRITRATRTAAVLAFALVCGAISAQAQSVTISGKLIDRVCSVLDTLHLQPATEKRCTLWVESSYACPTGTCKAVHSIYCPNAAVDGRAMIAAYPICSDPEAMQHRHPTKTYHIQAYTRTPAQQLDGYGQFLGYQFQY